MYIKKEVILPIFLYTFIFFLIIFSVDTFFFSGNNEQYAEENFIDISSQDKKEDFSYVGPINTEDKKIYNSVVNTIFLGSETSNTGSENNKIGSENNTTNTGVIIENNPPIEKINEIKKEYNAPQTNYEIYYVPESFSSEMSRVESLETFLGVVFIREKIYSLLVEINKELFDVRGKFKNKTIKLFGVASLSKEELISVFIHEFGHYIDLYFLISGDGIDPSEYFYEISWETTKVIKKGQAQNDFVSGYAMSNKYEDFAETFIYYILHNDDFFEKAQESVSLMKKYSFFEKYIFMDGELKQTNFGNNENIQPYYRDITKIGINLEKFLQFLKNGI